MGNSAADEQPGDRQQVMHRFGCGHTVRATRRTVRVRPEQCSDCRLAEWEAATPERRRQRRRELSEESKKLGLRPSASPAQRAAQQVIVALVQPSTGRSYLDPQTREFRITERRGEWGPSLLEVGRHLGTLGVPFRVLVTAEPRRDGGVITSTQLAIAPADRRELLVWVPSLAAKITRAESEIETDGPTST